MRLFGKKPKGASSAVLDRIDGKPILYVSERDQNNVESIIGRHGLIEIKGDTFSILCEGVNVFSCPTKTVEVNELQSRGGARIEGTCNGVRRTVTVFFVHFNK